jgi:hypothetical protein
MIIFNYPSKKELTANAVTLLPWIPSIRGRNMEIIFYVTIFFLIICAAALIAETWGEYFK